MANILSDQHAQYLIGLEKLFKNAPPTNFTLPGQCSEFDLLSIDHKEAFILTINRSSTRLTGKCTYQTRTGTHIPLVRVDINPTGFHRNPNGDIIYGNHIHLYKEGYGDRFAKPLESEIEINDPQDLLGVYMGFCKYCNIEKSPSLEPSLE